MQMPKIEKIQTLTAIALIVVTCTMITFGLSLFIPIAAEVSTSTSIISTMGNFVMVILGYFYGASDANKKQQNNEPEV